MPNTSSPTANRVTADRPRRPFRRRRGRAPGSSGRGTRTRSAHQVRLAGHDVPRPAVEPAARTWTRTSPSPISGRGICAGRSTLADPYLSWTIARINVLVGVSLLLIVHFLSGDAWLVLVPPRALPAT